jgi:hypothetical protein
MRHRREFNPRADDQGVQIGLLQRPYTREEARAPSVRSGAVMLGALASGIRMLKVACRRCERYCRLRVARLIESHSSPLTSLGERLRTKLMPANLGLQLGPQQPLDAAQVEIGMRPIPAREIIHDLVC